MNEETIIICESIYHGNTIRLAKAMAFGLNCKVINVNEASSIDLSPFKVIGLGSGIYFTSHHPRLINQVKQLNHDQKVFIFSSHGGPILGKYHEAMKSELNKRNIHLLGEFSSRGYDCTGPFIIIGGGNKGKPNEMDEQRAIKFISKILPQYTNDLTRVPKGHHVFVNNQCNGCGTCKSVCPLNVFVIENRKSVATHENECVHCSLCQKNCPNQAILINHSFIEAIKIAVYHSKKGSL